MKNLVKIAFVNYSLFAGGAERNVINLSRQFTKENIYTDIVIFKNINEYKAEYVKNSKNLHIIPIFKTTKKIPRFCKPFYALILCYRLLRLFRQKKYDLLIGSEEYDPFFITILFSRLLHIKSLLIVGNNINAEIETHGFICKNIYRMLFFISFFFSTHIICVSHKLKADLIKNFSIPKTKITHIYNGVDISLIKQKMKQRIPLKKKGYFIKKRTLITLGRLVYKKGFEHLIKAVAIVSKRFPNIKLLIIGKGPLKNKLREVARYLNIDKNVIFLGFEQTNPYRLLRKADIFIFSSLYEGFGNTIIEAMNCGLPIVSTNCPYGPEEILNKKWGLLVPYVSPYDRHQIQQKKEVALANTIIQLLTNNNLANKYKEASIARAQSFTLDIMGKKYINIINRLISK